MASSRTIRARSQNPEGRSTTTHRSNSGTKQPSSRSKETQAKQRTNYSLRDERVSSLRPMPTTTKKVEKGHRSITPIGVASSRSHRNTVSGIIRSHYRHKFAGLSANIFMRTKAFVRLGHPLSDCPQTRDLQTSRLMGTSAACPSNGRLYRRLTGPPGLRLGAVCVGCTFCVAAGL